MGSQGARAANPLGQSYKLMVSMRCMDHWLACWTIFRAIAAAMTVMVAVVAASGVCAQTLIEPNSKPKLSQPSGPAKSKLVRRTKSCSAFGAGFVQIPGTDTCVKIGGYISTEGAVNTGR